MTLAEILMLIQGVLAFPRELLALVKLIRGTPEAAREKMLVRLHDEVLSFQKTGRPSWSE